MQTSFATNRTQELWQGFMPKLKFIKNRIGENLISMEIYPEGFFRTFTPTTEFEKWACVPVSAVADVPEGMRTFVAPGGLYAVFLHRGTDAAAAKTYGYIFNSWFPASDFVVDSRPHFAVMGDKYKNNSQDSEEEIWIPVVRKDGKIDESDFI